MLHSVATKKDSLFGEYETMSFLEPTQRQKPKKKSKTSEVKMDICKWYDGDKLLMVLTKIGTQYFLDGKEIDNKIGCKLDNYNYKKALEVLKNEC